MGDAWGVKVELDEFSPSFFDVVVVLDYGALGADNDLKVVWAPTVLCLGRD